MKIGARLEFFAQGSSIAIRLQFNSSLAPISP